MPELVIKGLRAELAAKSATIEALMEGYDLSTFPIVSGLAFDVMYRPAETLEVVGGDWYDIFMLPDGRVAFTIGDVCGRGLGSAVKMAQARQAVKVAASLETGNPMPCAVLEQTNEVIFLNDHDVKFTTAIYGLIDLTTRKVTYASAGHHPPVLAKAGVPAVVMPNHGFPLGVERQLPDLIREHEFTFESNSLFVMYTDGLIEFSHDVEEGETRLLRAAREAVEAATSTPANFIAEHVLSDVPEYQDDVAVLTIFFE